MIDVTVQNFEDEVIAASMTTPVLVDFWAPWCGPCKSLGPVLEKLEEAYAGRFKLVKINSDEEQQLAAAFGIRSIPTCVLMVNGQPVDGFMGALPEGQVREFLDKHVPGEAELQGKNLVLSLGLSHTVPVEPPPGITFTVDKGQRAFAVEGTDLELVGEVASRIRSLRPPEPYKGKGVHYAGEKVRRKAGKAGKVGAK